MLISKGLSCFVSSFSKIRSSSSACWGFNFWVWNFFDSWPSLCCVDCLWGGSAQIMGADSSDRSSFPHCVAWNPESQHVRKPHNLNPEGIKKCLRKLGKRPCWLQGLRNLDELRYRWPGVYLSPTSYCSIQLFYHHQEKTGMEHCYSQYVSERFKSQNCLQN